MNGAESLVRTLVSGGIETCFANPGTSEIHIVAAVDRMAEMRCVLGLFEGVVRGAAHCSACMRWRPANMLFHLHHAFANRLSKLHNAAPGPVPFFNLV